MSKVVIRGDVVDFRFIKRRRFPGADLAFDPVEDVIESIQPAKIEQWLPHL